jgi:uroporphyrinogen decarboxylase
LQPLARFGLDAAIVFSDILTIPDAMGLGLRFEEGEGPSFDNPVRDRHAIAALRPPAIQRDLNYVLETLRLVREALRDEVPLIGFSGSPWTLLVYMVEGRSSREFALAKGLLYADPQAAHVLLDVLTQAVCDYVLAQIESGAQSIMIFDTWGGVLSRDYMQRIVAAVHGANASVPVTLFTKNGGQWLEAIADTGCDAVGIDWTTSISDARERVGKRVALQGNLDPVVLRGPRQVVIDRANAVLREFGSGSGHVFNLGHGVHQQTPPENVDALVTAVRDASPAYHD